MANSPAPPRFRSLTLLLGACLTLGVAGCGGTRPELGVTSGTLKPCPPSPNCVSSQATSEEQRVAPLQLSGTEPIQQVAQALQKLPRVEIVTQSEGYLHAEFTSAIFRFIDDVEFYWNAQGGWMEVRSASRLGYSDLGVNRDRIEELRSRLQN